MTYVDSNGKRVSAESAYLTPDVLSRPNLTVAIHASVTKILFETAGNGEPRAVGVEFTPPTSTKAFRAYSKKDVIVS